MSATEEILARGKVQGDDLASLRAMLVGPERALLRKLLQRLDDPATRAGEIARLLPEILALSRAENDTLSQALSPVVRDSLALSLSQNPDLLARAARSALR